jgi:hypothetical protein
MIVTRQRKKKQSSLPILLPIAAIAMLAIALTWPPSRNFITNGPLKPVATVLEADRKAQDDKDSQVAQLQKQIAAAANEPDASTPAPAIPLSGQQPPGAVPAAGGAPVAAPASEAIHRAAQQWSAMDPETAAAMVQKLPTGYVSTVFAQMSPDSVGPIMDALPAKVAALIVENGTNPQISAQPGR